MNERIKGRLSRPSLTRSGNAALLYGQWGGGADNGEDDNDNGVGMPVVLASDG